MAEITEFNGVINKKTGEQVANERIQECIENKSDRLDLSELGLTSVPIALQDNANTLNQHLIKLNLNNNQIPKLENLEALTRLTSLNLRNNQIPKLESLEALTELEILYLQNNNISDDKQADSEQLQALLSNKKLQQIRLDNNPFSDNSSLIFDDDYKANHINVIKLYIHNKNNPLQLPSKVVFLGNHASGKTSSLQIIHQHNCLWSYVEKIDYVRVRRKQTTSTHVLNIQYILPKKQDNKHIYTASCYDFGGQDFYHGIYRIFLHNANTAILVINPANNKNELNKQNEDTVTDLRKQHQTQYFDVRYWRGLLSYMHSKYSSNKKLSLFAIQSHGEQYTADWSLPNILNPVADKQTPTSQIELQSFHHLNLANQQAPHSQFFVQQFSHHIDKQFSDKSQTDPQTLNFVNDLMTRANEKPEKKSKGVKIYDCQPTTIGKLKDTLPNIAKEKKKKDIMMMLLAQIEQYHLAGMILYEKNLKINQSKNPAEHIVWLNPQALVSFIHEQILSAKVLNTNNGTIDKADFDTIISDNLSQLTNQEHKKAIVELLQIHQVIYQHDYKNGVKGDIEYIIPNYLPLSSEDNSYELIYDGMGTPAFCLAFTDFIPVGMINQFVNLFGKQPDKKLFWRDAMIFNMHDPTNNPTENDSKLFKIHLRIDMSKLNISVHIVDLQQQGKQARNRIISYMYYCIMNAYWSYITNVPTVNYEEFSVKNTQKSIAMTERDKNRLKDKSLGYKEREELLEKQAICLHANSFVQDLFALDTNNTADRDDINTIINKRIPNDMYISRDGTNFIKYSELFSEKDSLQAPCYRPTYLDTDKNNQSSNTDNEQTAEPQNNKPQMYRYDNSERMIRQTQTLAKQNFQPFTNEPLNKIARIFISYCHADREYTDALMNHLAILERKGHHIFVDRKINTGKFDPLIQQELEQADIVVFMMSANFFKSDYIFNKELTKVLLNNQSGNGKKQVVIPVLAKAFNVKSLSMLITDDFTQEHFDTLIKNNNKDKGLSRATLQDLGEYLFRPYYQDDERGIGLLKAIQLWDKDERDSAYAQISEVIENVIGEL